MLPLKPDSYEDIRQRFSWNIPSRYNIGVDVCDKWAEQDPGRLALIHVQPDGAARPYSFGEVLEMSNRVGNMLLAHGVQPGDRVGILLPQAPETAFAHIAAYKTGCIAIPLFALFGVEALQYRLGDSGARVVITNAEGAAKLSQIRDQLPNLQAVFTIDGAQDGTLDLHREAARHSADLRSE